MACCGSTGRCSASWGANRRRSPPCPSAGSACCAADGRPCGVGAYFEASTLLAVDTPDQAVTWGRVEVPGRGDGDWLRVREVPVPVPGASTGPRRDPPG